ncbi:MAG: hypothetical protein H7320_15665 [Ferruginibacter sp.]|nr:hypothetical protein [Ferruginibacter sp.]
MWEGDELSLYYKRLKKGSYERPSAGLREGLKWKAHSHEVRVARTWNVKPDLPAGGARPKYQF